MCLLPIPIIYILKPLSYFESGKNPWYEVKYGYPFRSHDDVSKVPTELEQREQNRNERRRESDEKNTKNRQ